jgi:hypothetical protein
MTGALEGFILIMYIVGGSFTVWWMNWTSGGGLLGSLMGPIVAGIVFVFWPLILPFQAWKVIKGDGGL